MNVQNTKYLYAICERHGIEFKPFGGDTRTHFCAWGVKADRKTEPQTELPNEDCGFNGCDTFGCPNNYCKGVED